LQARFEVLKNEDHIGQAKLCELEQQEIPLRETLLRISGAIQVVEKLLADEPRSSVAGDSRATPARATTASLAQMTRRADMYVSKAALASSILGLLALITSTAAAQKGSCVDATTPPYCSVTDAQCWVSDIFYKNHIAESLPQAQKKMLDAYTTGDKRDRSTYFIPSSTSFYKQLRTVAGKAGKSTLTAGGGATFMIARSIPKKPRNACRLNPTNMPSAPQTGGSCI